MMNLSSKKTKLFFWYLVAFLAPLIFAFGITAIPATTQIGQSIMTIHEGNREFVIDSRENVSAEFVSAKTFTVQTGDKTLSGELQAGLFKLNVVVQSATLVYTGNDVAITFYSDGVFTLHEYLSSFDKLMFFIMMLFVSFATMYMVRGLQSN